MRSKCRLAIFATMLAAALALPASASAQIEQFSLSPEVQLGPEGASATTTVTVQCAEGWFASLAVNVVQNTGGRLASGSRGSGFTCTGEPQTLTVPMFFSIFALKQRQGDRDRKARRLRPGDLRAVHRDHRPRRRTSAQVAAPVRTA